MSIKVEVIENLTPIAPFATLASIGKDPGKAIFDKALEKLMINAACEIYWFNKKRGHWQRKSHQAFKGTYGILLTCTQDGHQFCVDIDESSVKEYFKRKERYGVMVDNGKEYYFDNFKSVEAAKEMAEVLTDEFPGNRIVVFKVEQVL